MGSSSFYITLHYITLHYITLHYITLHYITLHYITLHYITLDISHIGTLFSYSQLEGELERGELDRGQNLHKSLVQVRFPHSASYVGWVCCWFCTLLREVYLRVLRFPLSSKTNIPKFQFDPDAGPPWKPLQCMELPGKHRDLIVFPFAQDRTHAINGDERGNSYNRVWL